MNDELTMDVSYPIGGTPSRPLYNSDAYLYIMFDPTHFSSGQALTVKMKVTADGVEYQDSYSVNAINIAQAFGRDEWETVAGADGATQVKREIDTFCPTISCTLTATPNWNASTVQSLQDGATVLYFNRHGNERMFSTDSDEIVYSRSSEGSPDFLSWRMSTIGPLSYLPPFNTNGKPPINLCVLDSCDTGEDDAFKTVLFPYGNQYTFGLEDQAMCGWAVEATVLDTAILQSRLWHDLISEEIIEDAVNDMIVVGNLTYHFNVTDNGTTRLIDFGDFRVYGDPATRLHGVYTGDSMNAGSWWRQA